jgi:hypothetical protein
MYKVFEMVRHVKGFSGSISQPLVVHVDTLVILLHRESYRSYTWHCSNCLSYTFSVLLRLQVYMDIAVILSEAHQGVSLL